MSPRPLTPQLHDHLRPAARDEIRRHRPIVQVRHYLIVARRQGFSFEEAWLQALRMTKFEHDTMHRKDTRAALDETRDAWEAAYHGEDVPGGRALIALADMLAAEDDHAPPPVRVPLNVGLARDGRSTKTRQAA
jgi:hypothetical protein